MVTKICQKKGLCKPFANEGEARRRGGGGLVPCIPLPKRHPRHIQTLHLPCFGHVLDSFTPRLLFHQAKKNKTRKRHFGSFPKGRGRTQQQQHRQVMSKNKKREREQNDQRRPAGVQGMPHPVRRHYSLPPPHAAKCDRGKKRKACSLLRQGNTTTPSTSTLNPISHQD